MAGRALFQLITGAAPATGRSGTRLGSEHELGLEPVAPSVARAGSSLAGEVGELCQHGEALVDGSLQD